MEDRPYTATDVKHDFDAYWRQREADFIRRTDAADWIGIAGRAGEVLGVDVAAPGDSRSVIHRADEDADAMAARVRVALAQPPGLGGPREFAVPGAQLIALMEHVAAVRRIARRGWKLQEGST